MLNDWIYDIETYPNVFTVAFEHTETSLRLSFEISEYRDDTVALLAFLDYLHTSFARMVGFNNLGFDYPVIHTLLKMRRGDVDALYSKAMAIINAPEYDRFVHLVRPSDYVIPQVDLFKIHHFDNAARATSLKVLEFNMRAESIQDLPFPVGQRLTREQVEVLKQYNAHDVSQTKAFYHETKAMLAFRAELTEKYGRDFTNHNDTKIGKDYFVMELEKAGVDCYKYSPGTGRTPRQTPRLVIHLRDAILPWIVFEQPEFNRVLTWFKDQAITETKGVFKDLTATVNGFTLVFGTGGIHGSVDRRIVEADDQYMILDLDVTSYYPNLAIQNGLYPEHLGEPFVHIYKTLFEQRKTYDKKSAESAMLKLALNGVYGDSNSRFSVFYDPLFTMRITLNGQLLLCLLAERLMGLPDLELLQVNTDGLTVRLPRADKTGLDFICKAWEMQTRLKLESVEYRKVCIRDVNNYLAVSVNGVIKRKGAYEYNMGWHQDHSGLVVPKVAELALVHGVNIRNTVEAWPDPMDFMYRIKVPRSSHLLWGDEQVQNTTRYLVTKDGRPLTKVMPPLAKKPLEIRRFAVRSGWMTTVCNDLKNSVYDIDFNHYVQEVEKLVMELQ